MHISQICSIHFNISLSENMFSILFSSKNFLPFWNIKFSPKFVILIKNNKYKLFNSFLSLLSELSLSELLFGLLSVLYNKL